MKCADQDGFSNPKQTASMHNSLFTGMKIYFVILLIFLEIKENLWTVHSSSYDQPEIETCLWRREKCNENIYRWNWI